MRRELAKLRGGKSKIANLKSAIHNKFTPLLVADQTTSKWQKESR